MGGSRRETERKSRTPPDKSHISVKIDTHESPTENVNAAGIDNLKTGEMLKKHKKEKTEVTANDREAGYPARKCTLPEQLAGEVEVLRGIFARIKMRSGAIKTLEGRAIEAKSEDKWHNDRKNPHIQ